MILRTYRGHRKSARRQQMNADILISYAAKIRDFSVLRESYREILEDRFDVRNLRSIMGLIHAGRIRVVERRAPSPGPMSFGLAAMGARDVVSVEDRISLIREYHRRVLQQIGEPE
jgi:ATP-dependent Lhr-like helicase